MDGVVSTVPEPTLKESYQYAARLTRAKARNFAYSFWFLTPDRRRGISTIYAYSRRLDDCVDAAIGGTINPREAWQELERLRALLDGSRVDPLGPALRDTIQKFSIPHDPFHELIAGMGMDLEQSRYRTFEDLRTYCYRAASTVGLICIEIFGKESPEARDRAIDLGIAMQLTNVLRDIPEDLGRGRIYLPTEELSRFGYSEEELEARSVNDSFRSLMKYQVERARGFFNRSAPLLSHIRPESRRCPALLASFYQAILERIENSGYDVFRRRPGLSTLKKLQLVGAHLFRDPRIDGK